MQLFVAHIRTKRDMISVLEPMMAENPAFSSATKGRAVECASKLLAAGVDAGTIRNDVDGADLVRAVSGSCMSIGSGSVPRRRAIDRRDRRRTPRHSKGVRIARGTS